MDWWRKLKGLATGTPTWPEPTPTADYYLLGGIGDLVSVGDPSIAQPIVRIGPNAWAYGDRLVIVRYLTKPEAETVEARRWQSVYYVIDDLITEAARSFELPSDYRERLSAFARDMLPRILAMRPVIVAPSTAILDAFPGFERRRLDPCCLAMREGSLPDPPPPGSSLEIAFLGTRSHLGSLPLLAEVARRLERGRLDARLHLFFGRHLPREVSASGTIVIHDPIPWSRFADFCRRTLFHIALAPVQATPFAMARSITEVMDHAAVGAAGLYGNRPPFAGVITHNRDGLLLGDDPAEWADAIQELAADPDRMSALAANGSALAARLGDPARLRRFWVDGLAVDPSLA